MDETNDFADFTDLELSNFIEASPELETEAISQSEANAVNAASEPLDAPDTPSAPVAAYRPAPVPGSRDMNAVEGPRSPASQSGAAGALFSIGDNTGVRLPNNAFVSMAGQPGSIINFDLSTQDAVDPSQPMTIATVGTNQYLVNTTGPGTVVRDASGNLVYRQASQTPSPSMLTSPQFAAPVIAAGLGALANYLTAARQSRTERQIARAQLDASLSISRQGAAEQRRIAEESEASRADADRTMASAIRRRAARRSKV